MGILDLTVPSYQHPKAPLLKLEMPLSRLDVPVIRPLRIGQMGNDLGEEAKEAAPGHRDGDRSGEMR